MAQRDYILRMFEEMSRAIAQVIYHQQIKDYQAAHDLIDEQLKQTLGMGRNFILSLSDEMLLSMLTTLDTLNIEKCWLVSLLLKVEGDLAAEEQDENRSFYCYLKACNLLLEVMYNQHQSKDIEKIAEIEELWKKLEDYELPVRTRQMLFWYFECTGRYGRAEDMLFDMLETGTGDDLECVETAEEMLEKGEAFYARLLGKSDAALEAGNFSRSEIGESLKYLRKFYV